MDCSRTAHLMVDLQNGFLALGCRSRIPIPIEIVPAVNRISAASRNAGGLVVYICRRALQQQMAEVQVRMVATASAEADRVAAVARAEAQASGDRLCRGDRP
jgi:nicotinamidase-related amidase